MCMTESIPCSPETITTLLIGYTPIQKKKFKEKKRCDIYIYNRVLLSCKKKKNAFCSNTDGPRDHIKLKSVRKRKINAI